MKCAFKPTLHSLVITQITHDPLPSYPPHQTLPPALQVNLFQLLPSIFAQSYPRQFLQSVPAVYATVSASLFIESLGLLHATFLIVDILEKVLPTQSAWERGSGAFGSYPSKFSSVSTGADSGAADEEFCSTSCTAPLHLCSSANSGSRVSSIAAPLPLRAPKAVPGGKWREVCLVQVCVE